ncbi:response regulator transcription factor [Rhodopirellula halodulae]|uniref:response regulator transcription factor n=1 Tax=Rhodopirellula halodulae TaxID=2894198 RepID=UPI001E5C185F|nr:LuxR C-terminal-related transcriptional regulator [Rhodopirellula sp. JC737]MCC9655259.1 LuxR C-terminal-related transcriptional regulator [Rhodopirellula sp. JC737]
MNQSTVFLIEDESSRDESVVDLLHRGNLPVQVFRHPSLFYEEYDPNQPGCMVMDLNRSLVAGVTLAEQIHDRGYCPPYIIVGGQPRTCDLARAMRSGARDFFEKPVEVDLFLQRIREAIAEDHLRRQQRDEDSLIRQRIESLSPRESEILNLVMEGKLSKQIASHLEISIKTVEAHRANILRKMHVDSFIQVVCLIANRPQLLQADSISLSTSG